MIKINQLYPCGEDFEEYLEYRLVCPQCGETIHIFFPADIDTHNYKFLNNTCHSFNKSINRGSANINEPKEQPTVTPDSNGGKEGWTCSLCATKVMGKFCPVCGSPSPQLQ